MPDLDDIEQRLSRLSLNLIPLPAMAINATRKNDREVLRTALEHVKLQVSALCADLRDLRDAQ